MINIFVGDRIGVCNSLCDINFLKKKKPETNIANCQYLLYFSGRCIILFFSLTGLILGPTSFVPLVLVLTSGAAQRSYISILFQATSMVFLDRRSMQSDFAASLEANSLPNGIWTPRLPPLLCIELVPSAGHLLDGL